MKIKYLAVLLLMVYLSSCSERTPRVVVTPRDTTITVANAVSDLFLDSSRLESFITSQSLEDSASQMLRNFYNSRNYQFAWFTQDGLAEQTRSFWNLHDNYIAYSRDTALTDVQLHKKMQNYIDADTLNIIPAEQVIETELQLTIHFFRYAQYAYAGKVDPKQFQWLIPRKKVNAMALLDSLIANKGKDIEQWEPVNPMYRRMQKALQRYDTIENNGRLIPVEANAKNLYKMGDSSSTILQVKNHLRILGDYPLQDTSQLFTPELAAAVKQAQQRFGIKADGIINAALLRELNVPIQQRIKQMLINLERMRWMPKEPTGNRIVTNIPEFKMHVFDNFEKVLDFDVVVGTSANKTVIFNNMLKYVVFSPYWNVPASIVRKEIVPGMRRSSGYLKRMNMEQTGSSNGLPVIRQKPGRGNSLGQVKFIFPNEFDIYFHDTPSKWLFEENKRAFSHGCIRVKQPQLLAEFLLRDQPQWSAEAISTAMNAPKEKWVTLQQPVPVVITYLTSWVSKDGHLNFREDIYGHDARMAETLFTDQALK